MTSREMLDHFLRSRGAAAFDQDKIARHNDVIQKLCGFGCRADDGCILQTRACCAVGNRGGSLSDQNQVINFQRRGGFADFLMSTLGFCA
jgi:hypothetical protein